MADPLIEILYHKELLSVGESAVDAEPSASREVDLIH